MTLPPAIAPLRYPVIAEAKLRRDAANAATKQSRPLGCFVSRLLRKFAMTLPPAIAPLRLPVIARMLQSSDVAIQTARPYVTFFAMIMITAFF